MGAYLNDSLSRSTECCAHKRRSEEAKSWDQLERIATNEIFHWVGFSYLHRRVLGKAPTHDDVQDSIRQIAGAVSKVRRGSRSEVCMLLPLFIVGCDASGEKLRLDALERLKGVDRLGTTQVRLVLSTLISL